MDVVTTSFLRFPRFPRIAQQLLLRDGPVRSLGELRNHLCVIGQSRQVTLGQPSAIAPFLDRRGPVSESLCNCGQPNKSNRACNGAHWYESVHRKWKVSRDLKCKGCGANSAGARRHPYNEFLGATAGGQQRCWSSVWSFRYRPRTRCLAERCPKMAGRSRLTGAEKSDHVGHQSWRQYRMAKDWARLEIR